MRKLFFSFVALLAVGCTEAYQQGVPAEWRADLDAAIASSERGEDRKSVV